MDNILYDPLRSVRGLQFFKEFLWLFIVVSLIWSPVVEGNVSTYAFCELTEKRKTLKIFLGFMIYNTNYIIVSFALVIG